jgi:hypothetical protein
LGSSGAIPGGREAVTAELEEIADLVAGGKEALGVPG